MSNYVWRGIETIPGPQEFYIAQGLRLGSKIPGSVTVNNAKKIKGYVEELRDIISVLIVNKVCLLEYSF